MIRVEQQKADDRQDDSQDGTHMRLVFHPLLYKYDDGLVDVEKQIDEAGAKLAELIPQLKGNDADNKALAELFNLMSPL